MKRNLINKCLIFSGLLAIFITGCDKVSNGQPISTAVAMASTFEGGEIKIDDKKGESTGLGLTMLPTKKIESPELVNKAVNALKNYFDISVNLSEYEVDVVFFEGFEDVKPSYSVDFMLKGNRDILDKPGSIGEDGYPIPEVEKLLKPEYYISFSETKELTDLYTNYVKWENLETSLSMEQTKKLARDFLISKQLAESDKIEFMGAANMSEDRIVVTYQIGSDSVIQVHVNTFAGKVDSFGKMTKEHAEMILSPKEEGFGVG